MLTHVKGHSRVIHQEQHRYTAHVSVADYYQNITSCYHLGRSSGGRALSGKGLDPHAWLIDPAWWMHL